MLDAVASDIILFHVLPLLLPSDLTVFGQVNHRARDLVAQHTGGSLGVLRKADFVASVTRLQWAVANGLIHDDHIYNLICEGIFDPIVEGNHLEVLRWSHALDPNYMCIPSLKDEASRRGEFELLRFLHDINDGSEEEWDASVCYNAAVANHLPMLQWLRGLAPPCPWNVHTTYMAVYSGNLEMLQWARAQTPPCPWDENIYFEAYTLNRFDIITWWLSLPVDEQPPHSPKSFYEGCCSKLEQHLKASLEWKKRKRVNFQ